MRRDYEIEGAGSLERVAAAHRASADRAVRGMVKEIFDWALQAPLESRIVGPSDETGDGDADQDPMD